MSVSRNSRSYISPIRGCRATSAAPARVTLRAGRERTQSARGSPSDTETTARRFRSRGACGRGADGSTRPGRCSRRTTHGTDECSFLLGPVVGSRFRLARRLLLLWRRRDNDPPSLLFATRWATRYHNTTILYPPEIPCAVIGHLATPPSWKS